MCRWLAYAGRPVFLEQLLSQPQRSLIDQALRSRKSISITNGDGFGVGWYGARPEPGLYREDRPAWNDDNLRSIASQISSGLVFAHVRAATGGGSSRTNCHPFRLGRWLFMHNGQIGGYDALARDLDFALAPALYRARQGATDSETLFLLAATVGLDADPLGALARAVGFVEHAMQLHGVTEPLRLTAALTDGVRVYAVRYASDRAAPTLFYAPAASVRAADGSCCLGAAPPCPGDIHGAAGSADPLQPAGAVATAAWILASEPLDATRENWTAVPEGHAVIIEGKSLRVQPWEPVAFSAGADRLAAAVPASALSGLRATPA
jgi:predicted glutamine amidotransferase